MRRLFSLLWLIALLVVSRADVAAANLTVFAAASLSDALQEIAPAYARANGGSVRFSFGASGTLARQIREGAPADVFLSADEARLNQLAAENLVEPRSRRNILSNTLVLVVPVEDGAAVARAEDLATSKIRRLALGEPAWVPAGTYAREYLESRGLWAQLRDRMVPLDNVRAVLGAVASGNADAGFVYRTDALPSRQVRIAFEVPQDEGRRIIYPAAVVSGSAQPETAAAFMAFLTGSEARTIFERHGFLPAE